jgi:hypothetical protein
VNWNELPFIAFSLTKTGAIALYPKGPKRNRHRPRNSSRFFHLECVYV